MTYPLVDQLRFARSEMVRCLEGVSAEDAVRRVPPMNCLSWLVGHLAVQESAYWVLLGQGQKLHPELRDLTGTGSPGSTPPLAEMWAVWREITTQADVYLDTLTPELLQTYFMRKNGPMPESVGSLLYRNIFHYWYHIGEAAGIRQALGHTNLPEFVGDLGEKAPYRPA